MGTAQHSSFGIMDVSFPCTFVPWNETTTVNMFVPGSESVDVSLPIAKLPVKFRFRELLSFALYKVGQKVRPKTHAIIPSNLNL